MHEHLLTECDVADITRLSRRTLERLRAAGTGPRFAKLGRRVFYRRSDLEDWIESSLISSTSAAREMLKARAGVTSKNSQHSQPAYRADRAARRAANGE